jgi:putative ABC transport system substrate-binding protein
VKRRAFIAGLGSAAAWPVVARAQQGDRVRRIGVLMSIDENDPLAKTRLSAFTRALADLGWIEGRNVRMEYRWGAPDVARARKVAAELIALAPDVILASASPTVAGLQEVTRTVPIVFVNVIDPVGAGFVESMSRPGGNTTGFTAFEYSISGKWLEMLKQIAPRVTRDARKQYSPSSAVNTRSGRNSVRSSAKRAARRLLRIETAKHCGIMRPSVDPSPVFDRRHQQ